MPHILLSFAAVALAIAEVLVGIVFQRRTRTSEDNRTVGGGIRAPSWYEQLAIAIVTAVGVGAGLLAFGAVPPLTLLLMIVSSVAFGIGLLAVFAYLTRNATTLQRTAWLVFQFAIAFAYALGGGPFRAQ
jgi:hypothetical protein